jgi:hypothetical protein
VLSSATLEEQTHLGWRQIFDGRWSRKWAYLQDQYLWEIGNKDPKYTGTTWLTAMLISTVWQQLFALWLERNATIHGAPMLPSKRSSAGKLPAKSTNGSTARTNCSNRTALTSLKPNLVQPLKQRTFGSPKTPLVLHLIGDKCTAPSYLMALNSPTQLPSRVSDK